MWNITSRPDYDTGRKVRGESAAQAWGVFPIYDAKRMENFQPSAASSDYWDNANRDFSLGECKQLVANGNDLVELGGGGIPAVRQIQGRNWSSQ